MPYTLSMALLWVALAVLLGIVVGWLMRSVVAGRQIERARSNHLDQVELDRARSELTTLRPVVAERDRLAAELDALRSADRADQGAAPSPGVESTSSRPAGAAPDDLTVIEGIGPSTSELCVGIGIQTWSDLAATEVSLLRTMLHDAGPRFRSLDPSTWPEQAALLAAGRWDEFREFVDRLGEEPPVG